MIYPYWEGYTGAYHRGACRANMKGFFRHRQVTKGRQPIVTISPGRVCVSSRSRGRPERSTPRSANSKRRVKVSSNLSVGQKRGGG